MTAALYRQRDAGSSPAAFISYDSKLSKIKMQTLEDQVSEMFTPTFLDDFVADCRKGLQKMPNRRHEAANGELTSKLPADLMLWQVKLLFCREEERKELEDFCNQIDASNTDEAQAKVKQVREIIEQKGPGLVSESLVTQAKYSRREQRFIVFLFVEAIRAGGYSKKEAIDCISEVTRVLPEFTFVPPSTLESWYNKSEPEYRGLKQLSGWIVSRWKRLILVIINRTLDCYGKNFKVAKKLYDGKIITAVELETIRQLALRVDELVGFGIELIQNAPKVNVNNGSDKIDIEKLLGRVLPVLESSVLNP